MHDRLMLQDFIDAHAPLDMAPPDEFPLYKRDGRWYQDNSSVRDRGVPWLADHDVGDMRGIWCEHVARHKAAKR